jgi:hypothetical protein
MKERGKYQIQCMKSRSSTGVGQKIDLEYNIETMRITDEGGDENGYNRPQSSIMESIKAKSIAKAADSLEGNTPTNKSWEKATGTPAWEQPAKVDGEVQSAKLKQLLSKIKTG